MSKKIKRNELDYLVTDILPVELQEMLSLESFYRFLNENQRLLDEIKTALHKERHSGSSIVFDKWHAMPLKYSVYKSHGSERQLALLNPFSMLEVYFFVNLYGESLLNTMRDNKFSLRTHKAKTTLYYIGRDKKYLVYGDVENEGYDIESLEATGLFFDITQFSRIKEFFKSEKWSLLNMKYKNYAKLDYQSCFDSIYTHTFKWLVSSNVIDSKSYSHTNHLYSVTDRVLQHINSSISNGIVVGPEFSRMIAELLLLKIDEEVYFRLNELGYTNKTHYEIYRYVDDIFVFANDENCNGQAFL